jgi:hypothetical protein
MSVCTIEKRPPAASIDGRRFFTVVGAPGAVWLWLRGGSRVITPAAARELATALNTAAADAERDVEGGGYAP